MLKPQQKQYNGYLVSLGLGCLIAFLMFLPFLIVDGGFFLYAGDFNSQQIPFYMYNQGIIKSGGASYSWASDLGSGLVTTYSFYLLGSPFFWLTLLFPTRALPFLMVPLLCLKFGIATLGGYTFLRRYTGTRNWAIIGGLLYAFSGFSIYNIFFNHFVDVIALFPFLLWSMDCYVYEKKRGLFPIFVAINLLNNFFFFAGQCVFLVIYFLAKLACKEYRLTLKEFAWLVFEAVIGVGMGFLLALPTAFSLIENPRVDDVSNGFSALMYYKVQQYFAIFASAFLPPDPPYMPNIFTEGAIKWTSMSAYLPLCSMSGVIAFMRSRKKSGITRALQICFFMAFVPILNSAFYAFNSSYYARWFYMPILLMSLCTVHSLESADIDITSAIKTTAFITALFLAFGLMPAKADDTWKIGVSQYASKFWLTMGTAAIGLLVFYILVRYWRRHPRFTVMLLAAIMSFSCFYGIVHIALGKFPQWDNDADYKTKNYDSVAELQFEDNGFYRIDSYGCYDNLGLFTNQSCIQFFNSTISPSIMEFYPYVGVKRDVSSKPEHTKYALRGLLSVEYLVTYPDKMNDYVEEAGENGFVYCYETSQYTVFKNTNFVPMGFTYDNYILMEDLDTVAESNRSTVLMRAIGLTAEQAEKYGASLTQKMGNDMTDHSYSAYVSDCDARRRSAGTDFDALPNGFKSTITLERDNLVFYSVPYEKGFTATVNGEPAVVEKVSGGLIAIPAPAGECEIVVTYRTPGMRVSLAITFISLLIWACYTGYFVYKKKTTIKAKGE
ncbi:MAG: YfhO family protein [Oscillospiraceae bacterium]|nr:YfhO family protein [Oscillospiraceae bacterium]